ncbi:MAG: hypothetical protein LBE36_04585 [Flavobacteriaceae bacterium]|jgi:hypothetical protein|nr:hypothetical protein [Flavobacteriaceae bacterium]
MNTIKEKLHQYIDTAAERKLQAMYIMLEDEIEYEEDYADEFKNELDKRFAQYQSDGIAIDEKEANQRIDNLMQKLRNK